MSEEKVVLPEPPSNGVILSPGGEIQYYSATLKHKNNPYINEPIIRDEEANIEYREVECNGRMITLSTADLNRALRLECKSTIVRILCLMDFFMNIFAIPDSHYRSGGSIIIAFVSIVGFYSTYTYNRLGLISYLIYQYIQSVSKVVLLSIYITAAISQKFREQLNNEKIVFIKPTPELIVLLSVLTLGQIYITIFIQSFYNILPTVRITLRRYINSSTYN